MLLAGALLAGSSAGAGAADCDTSATAAAQSLATRIDADGRFVYRISAAGRVHPGYNIVRHAGSLWALAAYRQTYPDAGTIDAASERASAFLARCCLRAPRDAADQRALWSVPEGEPLEAKLGAAGLALAAWSDRRRAGQAAPALEELRGLARFIVRLQRADGHFDSKFTYDRPDDSGWTSLYYPGEAALGLLSLARIDPDPAWSLAAERALTALATARSARQQWPADHWALIATAVLLRDQPLRDAALLREQVRQVAVTILATQRPDGAFDAGLRTAPAATRIEALIAADQVLGTDDPLLRPRLRQAIARGAAFLRRAQRVEGPHAGSVTRAAPGSTAPRAGELRIDDTQHALSVWLAADPLQNESCTRVRNTSASSFAAAKRSRVTWR